MKKWLLSAMIASVLSTTAVWAESSTSASPIPAEKLANYRDTAAQFMGALKQELQAAVKEGGPVNGIAACSTKAKEVAQAQSQTHGFQVGRTSLKLRNSNNQPDDWEKAVLEKFEARKAAGEDLAKMEYAESVTMDGKPAVRYMKAISTADMCLVCHGDALAPEVRAKLDEAYPQDQARDFKLGDLRGAFTFVDKR